MDNKEYEIDDEIDENDDKYFNSHSLILFTVLIGSFIWLKIYGQKADYDIAKLVRTVFSFSIFITILYTIYYIKITIHKKNVNRIKEGSLKYTPYTIDKTKFIEECKTGLIYSIVRIDNKIYELEVQPENKEYDKYVCYINNKEIVGLDNFLNYKYDGIHCLNDLKHIEFLEYNETDPRKYFIDHII